ncbi:MAG: VWA domain-containing protein [Anaerolineae bacterium]
MQRLTASVNRAGRRWQTALWFVALAALLVALARPQWGTETREVEQEGIEVMVALDVSNSMLAQDIKPDRLSRAKMEVADLMTRLGGNEIGLVLFSGASFIQFPLTADYNTAMSFLDNARPQVISKQGTNMGDAIRTALTGFDFDRPSQKVLVLITDGEAHDADVTGMAQQAADRGVRIYTVGFGSTEGEPIPEYDAAGNVVGYKRDQRGEVVLSRLDEATLRELARIGGGSYHHAGTGGDLSALTAELDSLQKSALSTQVESWGIERFQLVLWVALLALLLHELIPDRLRQKVSRRAAMGKPAPVSVN